MRIELADEPLGRALGRALIARGHRIVAADGELRIATDPAATSPRTLVLQEVRALVPPAPAEGTLGIAPLDATGWRGTPRGAWRPRLHVERLADAVEAWSAGAPPTTRILADDIGVNPVYRRGVRLIDWSFVLLVLLLSPLALLLVLWIRLDSDGPALFSQARIGRRGRPFDCLKFRTMRSGTRQAGTHAVPAAAVTRPGRLLRRLKLDELPQAWNIARGEMSLVGPRPCLPSQAELVARRRARGVLALRPGITGLAQVEAIDMSAPERLARRDADYVALRCLALDLWLIAQTLRGGGRGDRTDGRA